MSNLKRLARRQDALFRVKFPLTKHELTERRTSYRNDFIRSYRTTNRELTYRPVKLTVDGVDHWIQVNFCDNPFCAFYGLPQDHFPNPASKKPPGRYEISADKDGPKIICHDDLPVEVEGTVLRNQSRPYSNWSVAEEITRLMTLETLVAEEPAYEFHRPGCTDSGATPDARPESFRKRGRSSGKSQKWQCKTCGKITSVRPSRRERFNYDQERNDVLPLLAELLISRVPVVRCCEILQMSPDTFYSKLEWLYRCCIAFLERHERLPLAEKHFDETWIDTDQFVYYLNSIKRRGYGDVKIPKRFKAPELQTHIVISGEMQSRYILRADVAFDWSTSMEQVKRHSVRYCEDWLDDFCQRYGRFKYGAWPKTPITAIPEDASQCALERQEFNVRRAFVEGQEVKDFYTVYAQYWLIKRLVNTQRWRIVSDSDGSIANAVSRAFVDEIRRQDCQHLICKVERRQELAATHAAYREATKKYRKWVFDQGDALPDDVDPSVVYARTELAKQIDQALPLYEVRTVSGKDYPLPKEWQNKVYRTPFFEHPLPSRDEGCRRVACTTNLHGYSPEEIAALLAEVNGHTTSAFASRIRRSLNILERPLVSARGRGKTYVYSNINPRYAQYAVTILRVWNNFIAARKLRGGGYAETPAQRLGIADRKFTWRDVIYFR